jgi:hypothetical protein
MLRATLYRYLLPVAVFSLPFVAAAQSGINRAALTPYSNGIINIINTILVPVLLAIAFLMFVWGVFKYFIWGADNDGERATGRQFILWSIIGFAVIFSVWGLVNVLITTFNIPAGGNAPSYPTL